MELNLTVRGNSATALAFIEYAKTLDFIEFSYPEKTALALPEIIEEDQEHYDFIMELSKKTNKKVAMRLAKEKGITLPSQKKKL